MFHLHDSASSTVQVLRLILVAAFTASWAGLLWSLAVLLVLPVVVVVVVVVVVDLPHEESWIGFGGSNVWYCLQWPYMHNMIIKVQMMFTLSTLYTLYIFIRFE